MKLKSLLEAGRMKCQLNKTRIRKDSVLSRVKLKMKMYSIVFLERPCMRKQSVSKKKGRILISQNIINMFFIRLKKMIANFLTRNYFTR